MKILNKFFGKKKYDVDDEDLVWKREDTNQMYDVQNLQEVNQSESKDMFMPRSYTSKINPHVLEAPKNYHSQRTPKRSSKASVHHQSNQLNSFKQLYAYTDDEPNAHAFEGSKGFNLYETPKNYNQTAFDFNTQNDYNGGYEDHYHGNYNAYAKFNEIDVDNYDNDQMYNFSPGYNPSYPRIKSVSSQRQPFGQGFGVSPQKERNIKPELRDFYNIEENIMKKMMQSRETEKQPATAKNVNVFGGRAKVNNDKATSHFREAVKRNVQPAAVERKLPTEVKRRKNLVFKPVDEDGQEQQVETEVTENNEMLEMESQYIGKSIDELQRILREKNSKLAQLEEKHFQLVNNETNVTFIQKQVQELDRETAKLREKNNHLETEQRLLYEDLMNKKDTLNEMEVTLAKVPPLDKSDSQAKKELIDRISKNQQYINDLKNKLATYEEGKNKEIEDIKNNSDKNMQMELEEIKINIMNYDDELLKWMKYFEGKVTTAPDSNLLDQSIF